jgi:PRTRC genetic system protein A
MKLVDYVAATELPLPPIHAAMYEYVTASNGVFVRGQRTGLGAMLPVMAGPAIPLRGLVPVEPLVQLCHPCIPAELVDDMLDAALGAKDDDQGPVEALFHLTWDAGGVRLQIPPQERSLVRVRPVGHSPSYETAVVEVHSHHGMAARFSSTDDADETGFRIFGVLGEIYTQPTLRVRVGLYGHYWEIPAAWIFQLPHRITDAHARDYGKQLPSSGDR